MYSINYIPTCVLYYSKPARPNFHLEMPADFGNVVLAAKTIYKEIILSNNGAKAGRF